MRKLAILFLVSVFTSCSLKTTEDPVNKAQLIPPDQVSIGGVLAELVAESEEAQQSQSASPSYLQDIKQLQADLEQAKLGRSELDETNLPEKWNPLNQDILQNFERLSAEDVNAWVALNDSLLKYSQEVRFADALERVAYNQVGTKRLKTNQLKSFYYTRLYDRIFFNIFGSSSLQYEHTTGGIVRLVQATDYPFDDRVTIKVEIQDTRYLDLYIRIPEWATNSHVTVKGVKYPVITGEYTEIARKWKNSDEIEIIIGMKPEVVEKQDSAFGLIYGPLFLTHLKSSTNQLAFQKENPVDYLNMVSPTGKMPTFTFTGIDDTTLVLQPYFSEEQNLAGRTTWIQRR